MAHWTDRFAPGDYVSVRVGEVFHDARVVGRNEDPDIGVCLDVAFELEESKALTRCMVRNQETGELEERDNVYHVWHEHDVSKR